MSSAAAVLVQVLALLGGEARNLPPVELLDVRPPGVSANAEAFVRQYSDRIYLITSTPVYREAQRALFPHSNPKPFIKLASIIVHETWHLRHGTDERGAYQAQLMTLSKLGHGPGTMLYRSVWQSMRAVLKARPRLPEPTSTLATNAPK